MMSENVATIIGWIERMGRKHGGTVFGDGKSYDWGQAMCREMYGVDWGNSPEWKHDDDQLDEHMPTGAINTMDKWEGGSDPEWVTGYSGRI